MTPRAALGLLLAAALPFAAIGDELPQVLARVRPGVVAIAGYDPLGAPRALLTGSGFAVGDGHRVVTNAHVVAATIDGGRRQLVVVVGRGAESGLRKARVLREDAFHDLSLLEIDGPALTGLKLADGPPPPEGESVAFTGFPIGAVLGLYPVTHRGIISCVVPIAVPQSGTRALTSAQLKRLAQPFDVYQLDAIAYPGNSGSPVYELRRGEVVAVLNSVLVKAAKESALKDPSAIAYAIPIAHLQALLNTP